MTAINQMRPQTGRVLDENSVAVNIADKIKKVTSGAAMPNTAVAAVSLSGVSVPASAITVAAGTAIQLTAALFSNPGYFLLARVTSSAASAATALATAVSCIYHGQVLRVIAPDDAACYVHCLLVDADGVAAVGGASDYILRGTE